MLWTKVNWIMTPAFVINDTYSCVYNYRWSSHSWWNHTICSDLNAMHEYVKIDLPLVFLIASVKMNLEHELFSFQLIKSSTVLTSFAWGSLKCARILSVYQTPTTKNPKHLKIIHIWSCREPLIRLALLRKKTHAKPFSVVCCISTSKKPLFPFSVKTLKVLGWTEQEQKSVASLRNNSFPKTEEGLFPGFRFPASHVEALECKTKIWLVLPCLDFFKIKNS